MRCGCIVIEKNQMFSKWALVFMIFWKYSEMNVEMSLKRRLGRDSNLFSCRKEIKNRSIPFFFFQNHSSQLKNNLIFQCRRMQSTILCEFGQANKLCIVRNLTRKMASVSLENRVEHHHSPNRWLSSMSTPASMSYLNVDKWQSKCRLYVI